MLKTATNKPKLARANGKILLLKRSVEPFKGCWHLVGGHVEENETLKEALKREFKQETNLDVEIGGIIDGREIISSKS